MRHTQLETKVITTKWSRQDFEKNTQRVFVQQRQVGLKMQQNKKTHNPVIVTRYLFITYCLLQYKYSTGGTRVRVGTYIYLLFIILLKYLRYHYYLHHHQNRLGSWLFHFSFFIFLFFIFYFYFYRSTRV